MLGPLLQSRAWEIAQTGVCAAHSCWRKDVAGQNWLAVGDAALACDPFAAQGLFDALYFGLAAADSSDRYLSGELEALADYAREVERVRNIYLARRRAWYESERRWPQNPFWARRSALLQ
jgi:flavin-dependent dehydrogenase